MTAGALAKSWTAPVACSDTAHASSAPAARQRRNPRTMTAHLPPRRGFRQTFSMSRCTREQVDVVAEHRAGAVQTFEILRDSADRHASTEGGLDGSQSGEGVDESEHGAGPEERLRECLEAGEPR